ncbi:MAG: hypothetical protein M3436_15215 [Pseudomonadota bacterium]|nr:hypothetical protein [Pseudomonadota bacterium]
MRTATRSGRNGAHARGLVMLRRSPFDPGRPDFQGPVLAIAAGAILCPALRHCTSLSLVRAFAQ